MKPTIQEIKQTVQYTMTESLKNYINEPLTIDIIKDVYDQINKIPLACEIIIMSQYDYNLFMGIPNKIKYICC